MCFKTFVLAVSSAKRVLQIATQLFIIQNSTQKPILTEKASESILSHCTSCHLSLHSLCLLPSIFSLSLVKYSTSNYVLIKYLLVNQSKVQITYEIILDNSQQPLCPSSCFFYHSPSWAMGLTSCLKVGKKECFCIYKVQILTTYSPWISTME